MNMRFQTRANVASYSALRTLVRFWVEHKQVNNGCLFDHAPKTYTDSLGS